MGLVLPVEFEDGDGVGGLDIGAIACCAGDGRARAVSVVGAVGCGGILNIEFQFCEESGVDSWWVVSRLLSYELS